MEDWTHSGAGFVDLAARQGTRGAQTTGTVANPHKLGAFMVGSSLLASVVLGMSVVSAGLPAGFVPGGGQPPLLGDPGLSASHVRSDRFCRPLTVSEARYWHPGPGPPD